MSDSMEKLHAIIEELRLRASNWSNDPDFDQQYAMEDLNALLERLAATATSVTGASHLDIFNYTERAVFNLLGACQVIAGTIIRAFHTQYGIPSDLEKRWDNGISPLLEEVLTEWGDDYLGEVLGYADKTKLAQKVLDLCQKEFNK